MPIPTELTAAFDVVLAGDATPAQIAALLIGLRVKGETPTELAAVVRSFRRAMVALAADRPAELVDTCGTGGGTINTFNISTAAALVVAGAGVARREARQSLLHDAVRQCGRARSARCVDRGAGRRDGEVAARRGHRLHVRAVDASRDAPRRPGASRARSADDHEHGRTARESGAAQAVRSSAFPIRDGWS